MVSGFSSSNYLITQNSISSQTSETVEEQISFTTGTVGTQQMPLGADYNAGTFGFEISSNNNNNKILYRITYIKTNDSVFYKDVTANYDLSANTKYIVRGAVNTNTKQVSIELFDKDLNLLATNTSEMADFLRLGDSGSIYIGKHPSRGVFTGSIDLNSTYIKVNGQPWFGSVSKFQEFIPAPQGTMIGKDDTHTLNVVSKNNIGTVGYTLSGDATVVDGIGTGSGYSSGTWNTIYTSQNVPNGDFEITAKYYFENYASSYTQFFSINSSNALSNLSVMISSGSDPKLRLIANNSSGSWEIAENGTTVLHTGSWFYFKLIYKNSTKYFELYYSNDGISWNKELDATAQYYTPQYMQKVNFLFAPSLMSKIDLNKTYIKSNDQVWFGTLPAEPKLVGPVDYTVVGSPTISNGMVSGFSDSNYFQVSVPSNTLNDNFDVALKIGRPQSFPSSTIYIMKIGSSFSVYMTNTGRILLQCKDSDNTSKYFGLLEANDSENSIKIEYRSANITTYKGTNGTNYTQIESVSFTTLSLTSSDVIYFGKDAFEGSIDLNNTYIKVNNTLWFGKENWNPAIYDNNSIVELVGHKSDYSQYDNYGFTPYISNSGTYDVWIDNQKVYENISSGTATKISWSDLALTTGYSITTPSALKSHVVKIEPSNSNNTITQNQVKRITNSGIEEQGRLQQDIRLDSININRISGAINEVQNSLLKSVDSKNSELQSIVLVYSFYDCSSLERIPFLNLTNSTSIYDGLSSFYRTKLKYIKLLGNRLLHDSTFHTATTLEKIDLDSNIVCKNRDFVNNQSLKMLPKYTFSEDVIDLTYFLTNDTKLLPTDIDVSNMYNLMKIDIHGDSTHFIDGLKTFVVSNQAPFLGTSPQINVSYTGLSKDAIVNLFNSLPVVTNGQTIDITSCTGANSLTLAEIGIATDKGWNVVGAVLSDGITFPYTLPITFD